jgi:hypothetical protein
MRYRVAISAMFVVMGCALSPATAHAEPQVPDGAYTITFSDDGVPIAWQFTPCGSDCTVANSPGSSLVANWRFQLAGGRWTYSGPQQIPCPHGEGAVPVVMTYSFDADSLAGDAQALTTGDGCGRAAEQALTRPFRLIKTS